MTYAEKRLLIASWSRATFRTRSENIRKHFGKHGKRMDASDVWRYLRMAYAFRQQLKGKGRSVSGGTRNVRRFIKMGRFIDLTADKQIISFGLVKGERNER